MIFVFRYLFSEILNKIAKIARFKDITASGKMEFSATISWNNVISIDKLISIFYVLTINEDRKIMMNCHIENFDFVGVYLQSDAACLLLKNPGRWNPPRKVMLGTSPIRKVVLTTEWNFMGPRAPGECGWSAFYYAQYTSQCRRMTTVK